MENKRKKDDWRERTEQVQAIFRKPTKLLRREEKAVAGLLDTQFPVTDRTGEMDDKEVSQLSHLKYVPAKVRELMPPEKRARRKAGLPLKGIKMHLSAYYQGLTWGEKGLQCLLCKLN